MEEVRDSTSGNFDGNVNFPFTDAISPVGREMFDTLRAA
jgi:hypothetical protein